MANQSGKNASIKYTPIGGGSPQNIVDCSQWTMDRSVNVFPYASCSTGGKTARITGTKDARGTLTGFVDDSEHISDFIQEGDEVVLYLYSNTTDYWLVPAFITSVSEGANIETGDLLRWNANWESTVLDDGTSYTWNGDSGS